MGINIIVDNPVYMGLGISQFTVNAPTGIGYAFWIRVDYRKNKHHTPKTNINSENAGIDIHLDMKWMQSDQGPSVSVWQTKSMNLQDIAGLEKGMEVRLDIEIRVGSSRVRAGQSFYYDPSSSKTAYYKAHGTSLNGSLEYIECRDK